MFETLYCIEAIFQLIEDEDTTTTTVTMYHDDLFICVSNLINKHYPLELIELHCEKFEEPDEDKKDV